MGKLGVAMYSTPFHFLYKNSVMFLFKNVVPLKSDASERV